MAEGMVGSLGSPGWNRMPLWRAWQILLQDLGILWALPIPTLPPPVLSQAPIYTALTLTLSRLYETSRNFRAAQGTGEDPGILLAPALRMIKTLWFSPPSYRLPAKCGIGFITLWDCWWQWLMQGWLFVSCDFPAMQVVGYIKKFF